MKRVYCLYRVSTKGQVDKDDIPMQRLKCNEFAKAQGWSIIKEFSEKGVSGFKVSSEDRDAVQDIKAAALRKEFDVLLVFMFDRLGRKEDEMPFVVEWFVKQGIEVWSTQEGEQRFENHVDKLMNYIRFWQASGESIKTRLQQLVKEGAFTGGNILYGYKMVKTGETNKKGRKVHKLEIEPNEAEIVKLMFEKTIKEGMGSYRLATFLNERGVRTHQGNEFRSNTVNRILRNKSYCGYIISGGVTSPLMENLKIIDENVFDSVQKMVNQRMSTNKERTIPLHTKGKTLLSGNIFCAHCGGRLTVSRYQDRYTRKDGTEYRVDQLKYTCYHKSRKLNDCDGQTSYIAETIDKAYSLQNTIKYLRQDITEHVLSPMNTCINEYTQVGYQLNDTVEKLDDRLLIPLKEFITGPASYFVCTYADSIKLRAEAEANAQQIRAYGDVAIKALPAVCDMYNSISAND